MGCLLIVLAGLLMPALLQFEKMENRNGMLPVKTLMSLLFVAVAAVQPVSIPVYFRLLLIGLVLCLLGDVCLVFQHPKLFLAGLVAFLLGHVFYVFAFVSVTRMTMLTWPGAVVVLAAGIWIFRWLKPHLDEMKVPVLIYMIVISVMLTIAWTVLLDSRFALDGRIAVFAGAFTFYLSDIFVARDRFLQKDFVNRLVGLPLYYAGQFLIAFSAGLVKMI